MQILKSYPVALARETYVITSECNLSLISAGVAFFAILSIFPGLAAIVALFGLVADPALVLAQVELMQDIMPASAYVIVVDQLTRLLQARPDTLGLASILSVLVALWSARAGVASLIRGLNAVFGHPNRHGLWHTLVALLMTLCLIGLALTAMSVVIIAPIVLAFLPATMESLPMIDALRWVAALVALVMALGMLYRFGPNRTKARLHWITPGAGVAVVLWLGASVGFSEYLANFGSYNEVYGSLGAVVALLMWLYISAYLILLGAALNVAREKLRTSRDRVAA
ncbi:YihY/virulence factor BrkB family protein [Aestuariibius sp. HNIBRBA575]|uniref:YihY/virulence factor BrkB family protein n=1 Tax=Aestuariibius sp. HNIBRBA575 TaxID=3233343 RepID=UPI0034A3AE1C